MRAGLMNKKIILLRPVKTETEFSVNEPTYEHYRRVWARIQHKSGTLEISADMVMNIPRVLFTIRDQITVEYGMMIEYKSNKYVILDIDDTTEKGALRITAEVKHE